MSEADQIAEAYSAAVFAKDVDAFVALFDPEVRIFDLWDAWSEDGLEAWTETVEGWFGSLRDERVEVTFESLQTTAAGALAAVNGFVSYRAIATDGRTLRSMRNRLTWVLRRSDGWKIVHQHTSAPIDGETLKVRFG